MEQPGFKPSDYTFFGGTEGPEAADLQRTGGPDVFCGFGGNDSVNLLLPGDIFLGGEGDDDVFNNLGTFYGGAGDDEVGSNVEGATFNGGDGTDFVLRNLGTISNVEEGDVELP